MQNRFRDFWFRLFRKEETRLHELNYLFWECTTRCNLRCIHCGSDCKEASGEKDMPLEDFLRAFDTIPRSHRPRNFTVVLTGGEPLLRSDLAEAGKAFRKRGVGWGMVSNGYLYDQAMHSKMMEAGMGSLTISLDGLGDTHEWMRGRQGTYDRAIAAIGIAARERLINFDVVTCVNKRNLPQLEQMQEILEGLGVKQWRIFTIIPIGRALKEPELHLTSAEFRGLMEFIKRKRERKEAEMKVTFSCEGYLGPYEMEVRDAPYMCHAGINIASVLIDGTICGCPNIDRKVFGQGNIYTDNFYEVWTNKFETFRDRGWAKRGMCKDCKMFSNCLGNGMHNWHGECEQVLNCHYKKAIGE